MDADYIVSMTTYHKRFGYAHLSIESILSQDCPYGFETRLYLSRIDIAKNGGTIPEKIERLTEKGLRIFVEDEDIRSYKKLIYALRDNPAQTIVTVDDDVIYPKGLLSSLIKK